MRLFQTSFPADKSRNFPFFPGEAPVLDVRILTSGGLIIPAHSSVLASASTVLENILERLGNHRGFKRIIPIRGVPCEAVAAFIDFLYTSRCKEEEMNKYGIHMLALSHMFSVPTLKQRSARELVARLNIDNFVDVLQLARLCNAPDLYVSCMNFISKEFETVQKTEGWKFVQDHDPHLELEILQFLDEAESRKKRWRKSRELQSLLLQLIEAMACLEHICTDGCTSVGPFGVAPTKRREPCEKFSTCQGLQLLIRHLATCKKRANGACHRCKRMWQLLRLHSSICDQPAACSVPLCRQFKLRMQSDSAGTKGEDGRWRLLVRKMISAKAMSSLPLAHQ